MSQTELAFQYASALFSLLNEKELSYAQKKMKEIDLALKSDSDFLHFLSSYSLPLEEKEKLIGKVINQKEHRDLHAFLCLIAKKHRYGIFHLITSEFISLCHQKDGVLEGICYSASSLSIEELARIENALSKKLSSKVSLTNVVDKRLLGGVKVAIDGKIFENSLKSQLEDMQSRLTKEGGTSL